MSDVPLHATRMGRTFYEHTMPDLVSAIERLASATAEPERDRRVGDLVAYAGHLCDATERVLKAPRTTMARTLKPLGITCGPSVG